MRIFTASRTPPKNLSVTHINWDVREDIGELFSIIPEAIHGITYMPGTIHLKPFSRFSINDFKNDLEINVIGAYQNYSSKPKSFKESQWCIGSFC